MSKVISPTIGRRVWYWPSDFDRGKYEVVLATLIVCDGEQPCDAGICYVHSDRLVNLTVADHEGKMHRRTDVTLVQPGDELPASGGYATWMNYQVEQAEKAAGKNAEKAPEPSVN